MSDLEDVEKGVDFIAKYGKAIKKFIEADFQKFAVKYNFALKDYYTAKIISLSKIKLPLFSSEVIDLEDIYIEQSIERKNTTSRIKQSDILYFPKQNKILIEGTAGAGKSCLMKNMFLEIIKTEQKLFPLFIELRKVNEANKSIFEILVDDISHFNTQFVMENLEFILDREGTVLFLDGLDEINYENKRKYIDEINQIAEHYPNLKLIVSSRPEYNSFAEFTLFNVYQISSLSLKQAINLIRKLQFDEDLKERFIESLKNGLYKTQEDFAKNPLLLTILIFTFEQCADIPDKLHIFYEYAYQTLFNRHDSYKQGYKRKRLTNLDIDEFKRVFSLFSLISYSQELFEFNENKLIELLEDSLTETEHENVTVENYKTDILSNVPLLMQDGLEFCFTHRSFQEYFTALYLVSNPQLDTEIYLEVGKRYRTDNVMNMMFSMNKKLVEDKWVLPTIENLLSQTSDEDTIDAHIKNFSLFFEDISLHDIEEEEKNNIGFSLTENYDYGSYLKNIYTSDEERDAIHEKVFSENLFYEKIDFIELVLLNKPNIYVGDLTYYEKELFCRMKGYRNAIIQIEILKLIRQKILNSREKNHNKIKELLLTKKK